ncbi:Putative peptidoglycan binding domain-containing protein [Streptomyces sp. Ag82_O1-12]|uniref:peptidoglycan-binding protein n=1 Tax=unclassified Streptomyces TaxID=2593676 RepID=UPI000BD29E51|nr:MULTISPECIES: peptidoglycan-binding protein [unclassified Streptomyces]SMQ15980.1 Putative peptidoglycan binding domain-containing protein [Streptomyces sp. Ag82_O1-12]SOD45007.1 Putative peptidoglycan binding domain-containing protein [Streptomyces sp. Ag82_G6-1]
MEPPNGHPCPECGAPRQRDNTPACACTHRAAEALRDARTAEAAAAEDFDPLRIRPYVEIDAGASGGPGRDTAPSADAVEPTPHAPDDAALRPGTGPAEAPPGQNPGARAEDAQGRAAADNTTALPHGAGPRPPGNGSAEATRTQRPGQTAEGTQRPAATANGATPAYEDAPRPPGNGSAEAPRPQGHGSGADGRQGRAATDSSGTPSQSPAGATPGPAAAADRAGSLPHAETPRPARAAGPLSPADATMPLRPVDPDATAVLPAAVPVTAALPTPLAPAATEPSVTDLRMFDGTAGADRGTPEGGRRRPRRRSTLLIAAAGACAAVVVAAGYASGLFSYESPSRDTALPDDIRASVPDAPSSSAASTPPQGSASAAPPAPAAPSPSRSGSPSVSPSPSAPSASASPSQSPSPSASQPSGSATGAEQAPPDNGRQKAGPTVLRLGDRGPEVTELQLRLRQLYLYDDDADGTFDDRLAEAVRTYQWSRGVQSDELGVYDRATREKLESETREP